ncbi:Sir2 family NAD-dependent protein deacetylase [Myxococcota bacterium]|nr:Sir2 family NAD-dependent protein deacetylase [Myxococcota bacterium]MBU1381070.1 Sir2 family NAD-dependent protein deacetylase [Myxococcota bacterium]MBU1496316.1 Sir2 family NAD-dependent protein deacetylase [Myxococcota bacterium]
MISPEKIQRANELIKSSRKTAVFTGAGISVPCGIPPFRGPGGVWNRYDPGLLSIDRFRKSPEESWDAIREIFYPDNMVIKPSRSHEILAQMESKGFISTVITQNIDSLHSKAGSVNVLELHGNSSKAVCLTCTAVMDLTTKLLALRVPRCPHCSTGLLKPSFTFFGEPLDGRTLEDAFHQALQCDLMICIGSTGEVMPAAAVPAATSTSGGKIIEINPIRSNFTSSITDLHLQATSDEVLEVISSLLF